MHSVFVDEQRLGERDVGVGHALQLLPHGQRVLVERRGALERDMACQLFRQLNRGQVLVAMLGLGDGKRGLVS